jgi:predicted transcriptional regulator
MPAAPTKSKMVQILKVKFPINIQKGKFYFNVNLSPRAQKIIQDLLENPPDTDF